MWSNGAFCAEPACYRRCAERQVRRCDEHTEKTTGGRDGSYADSSRCLLGDFLAHAEGSSSSHGPFGGDPKLISAGLYRLAWHSRSSARC